MGATMSQQPDTAKPLVLVTGASGYIASHIVQQLLQAGYLVRGTVRDTTNEAKVKHLKDLEGSERLELVNADLLEDGSFDTAMQGVEYVMHTASPFLIGNIKNPEEQLIQPAVQGTENVLKSASQAKSVKRVVLTSSCAAIYGFNNDKNSEDVLTEDDWNQTSDLKEGAYSLSKTLAEVRGLNVFD